MNTYKPLALLSLLLLGAPVDAAPTQRPEPRTVRARVQPRPGADEVELDMPVLAVPVDPTFVAASDAGLAETELVLGLQRGDATVAFPISSLASFEVINARVGDLPVAPTW